DYPLLHDGSLDIERWLDVIQQSHELKDPELMRRALLLAKSIADDAIAKGSFWSIDSLQMGLEMAQILLDLRLDTESVVAAILYRAVREGRLPLVKVEREFG